jgi:hypothetical protein
MSSEMVAQSRGRPEASEKSEEESYESHSTEEGGELAVAGTHWREGVNKQTYRVRETCRYTEIGEPCPRNSHE